MFGQTTVDGRRLASSVAFSAAVHASLILAISAGLEPDAAFRAPPWSPLTVVLPVAPSAESRMPTNRAGTVAPIPPALVSVASAPPLALPLPEPRYYSLSELDMPPVVIEDIPTDPPELQAYPQGGSLVVQLWIDELGHVTRAESLPSELPEVFAASARENFLSATFTPGRKDGAAVRARVKVEIRFQPR